MSKLITYGIYLLALTLSLQTRYIFYYGQLNNGPWDFGTISLFGIDLLITILLILTLFKNKIRKLPKIYGWLITGLVLFSLISITTALDQGLASFAVLQLALGLAVFWIIIQNNFNKLKFWTFFLLGALGQASLAIWQFLTQSAPANKWLGLALHNAQELGTSVVEAVGPTGLWERWLRAYGGFNHPNILGGFLALALIISIILFIKNKSKVYNYFFYLTIPIITAGLFFSFSRTGWLAMITGLIVIILQNIKQIKKLIIPVSIIIFTVGLLMSQFGYIALSRFGDLHRIEVKSIDERISYIEQAKKLIIKHPLAGVGIGNYGLAINQEIDDRQMSYWYQPVHNVPLLIWAETGIINMLLYLAIFVFLIITAIKNWRHQEKNSLILPIILPLLIIMTFDHWFWSLHFGQLLLWLMVAMVIPKKN